MELIKCTIEDLYLFNKENGLVDEGCFEVDTRYGLKKIEAVDITLHNAESIIIETESGKQIRCSYKHKLYREYKPLSRLPHYGGGNSMWWAEAESLNIGDELLTRDGYESIISITQYTTREDLYDIQVKEVKEFYANNFVSHNSTLREVIEYALFGRVDGFKLEDLPNRTNKNLEVYIKFQINEDVIEIERGIAPSYLRLLVNGIPDNRAGKKNIQEYIETELINIPYSVFKNIIVISINSFKSFLIMSPKDKREIVDKIFGFDVINDLSELVKIDKKILTQDISVLRGIIGNIESNIVDIENKIKKSITDSELINAGRTKAIKTTMMVVKNNIDDLDIDIKKVDSDRILYNKEVMSIEVKIGQLKQEIIEYNRKLNLYKNNKCTECETDLSTNYHTDRKKVLTDTIKSLKTEIIDKQDSLKTINSKLETTNIEYNRLIDNKNKLIITLKQLSEEYKFLTEQYENYETSALENVKTSLKISLEENTNKLILLQNKIRFIDIVEDAFSSNGIKLGAIENILPLLNKNIKESFENLSINFNVKIDSNFDCVVTSLGEEVNVKSLSTGERTRVDFGIIISLIKIIKLQYPTLNVLFLDEIFNSIDLESIDVMVDVVKNLSEIIKMNIFMVSHTPVNESLFDKKIQLKKQNNFTELNIQTL